MGCGLDHHLLSGLELEAANQQQELLQNVWMPFAKTQEVFCSYSKPGVLT